MTDVRGPLLSTDPITPTAVAGVYNEVAPAPADQQACALQLDSEGNLLVNVAVGGGGVGSVVKIEDSSGNALESNGAGALQVAVVSGGGSNASVGTVGSAVPASATQVGGSDGSALRALATDTSGQLKVLVENASAIPVSLPTGQAVELLDSGGVNKASISAAGALAVDGSAATQPVSGTVTADIVGHAGATLDGTAGSPSAGVLTVQGVSGGQTLPVTATIAAAQTIAVTQATAASLKSESILLDAAGTNLGTIKAASTPAAATDTSLVVQLNPAQPNLTTPLNIEAFGQYNASAPTPSTGQLSPIQQDQNGNLVQVPGAQFSTGAVWNSGTAQNTVQYPTGTTTQGQLNGADAILIRFNVSGGTFANGLVTIQGTYDNINWVTVGTTQIVDPVKFVSGGISNPTAFVSGTSFAALVLPRGYVGIRIQLSTAITGTGTVTPFWSTINTNVSSIPLVKNSGNTGLTSLLADASGNLQVNVAASSQLSSIAPVGPSAAAPANATQLGFFDFVNNSYEAVSYSFPLPVATTNIPFIQTGSTWASGTTSGTNQQITGGQSAYAPYALFVQLDQGAGISSGAITFQVSGDGGLNWATIPAQLVLDPTSYNPITLPYTLQASTQKAFLLMVGGYNAARISVSTTTAGGSVTPLWSFLNAPPTSAITGVYNSTLPTLTTGQSAAVQLDAKGQTLADLNYVAATALGAPTAFGSAPSGNVIGTNAELFVGTNAVSASAPVPISATAAANTNANPLFSSITDGTTKATVIAATSALKIDTSSIAGTATVAAAAGIQKVGISGNAGGTLDTAKGTQAATAVGTQQLHDAGRNTRIFMLDTITAAPLAEALATVVQWYGNAAVAGTTTPAVVPAGKTLRLTTWKIQYQSLATVGYAVVRVRANTGGTVVLASPLVYSFEAGSGAGATTVAMTGGVTTETGDFPEGLELPAGTGIGFSVAGYGPTGTLTLEGGVRFMVAGYEY